MGISSPGIGSGLDVNTIVTQLMNAERAPITTLQAKQSTYNAQLSAYGTLKSAVASIQTTLNGLDSNGLGARTATSSDTTVLSASVGSGATPGTYAIGVTQLAQQQKLMSSGYADPNATIGNGTLTIQVGKDATKAVTLPTADYSLQGLSNAINAAKAGVSATIVNDGTKSYLAVTADKSGADNTITITAGDPQGALNVFQFDSSAPTANMAMVQRQQALNAQFTVDGLPVEQASNTAVDVIKGVTLNLAKTNAGGTTTVTIANDKTTVKAAIKAFVDAYNKLNTTVRSMTAYDAGTRTGAVLNGDSGATGIVTALRKELTAPVAGAGSLTTLSDIGITFQRDGTLATDDTKLQKAMDGNFSDVATLFSGTDGYTSRLTAATANLLGTNGVITTRTNGFSSSIRELTNRQADMEVTLAETEKRYRAQFTALDSMMSSMQSTSSFLTQQLGALAKSS